MINYISTEEFEQGSERWHEIRGTRLTGTDAYDAFMGKNLQLILERKKEAKSFKGNYYTKRGHLLEDEAREIYSQVYNKIVQYGFIENDKHPLYGYSPDGIVDGEEKGLWECKAFQEAKHLKVGEALDPHVLAQIQLGLLITELPWCDLTLYNPEAEELDKKLMVKRVYADKDLQDILVKREEEYLESKDGRMD